jgi:hypothetical protein
MTKRKADEPMQLPKEDHRRFRQKKRAESLVKRLYHKGYNAKCIMTMDEQRVYFADCVKVILTCNGEGFVVRAKNEELEVIPNHTFFEVLDDTQRIDLIKTNFDGLLKIIRETINGKKYSYK